MALDDFYKHDDTVRGANGKSAAKAGWPLSELGVSVPHRYEGLPALSQTCRMLAYLTGAVAIVAAAFGVMHMVGGRFEWGISLLLTAVIGGFLQCTILFGLADAASALRDVEEGVRVNNELLRKIIRDMKQPPAQTGPPA